jgi:hypothetical protein
MLADWNYVVILDGILMLAVYGLIWGLFGCYGQALFRPVTVMLGVFPWWTEPVDSLKLDPIPLC